MSFFSHTVYDSKWLDLEPGLIEMQLNSFKGLFR